MNNKMRWMAKFCILEKLSSWIEKLRGPKEPTSVPESFPMPNLLVPWDAWPEANEYPLEEMRTRFGGVMEGWLLGIWLPYWDSLSEQERSDFLVSAPPQWQEWIKLKENDIITLKKRSAEKGYPFDHRVYFNDIALSYYRLRKYQMERHDKDKK